MPVNLVVCITLQNALFITEARPGYYVWGGLSFTHGQRGSTSLYRSLGVEPPAWVQGADPSMGVREAKPPEAESSVAFETLAEEPNLTLVTDWFLQFI